MADVSPESLNLHRGRWNAALETARTFCERDDVPAIGAVVGRSAGTTAPLLFGRQRLASDSPPLRDDAVFLVASITKPLVATAVLQLVERGQLTLSSRVHEIIPEFGKQGKSGISIRHLLTHTSGLPDMLPNNRELRAAHAPLAKFVDHVCNVKTHFPPGRGVRYQSMGFCILGEIIRRLTGRPCAEVLREEIFRPLGMNDTVLGAPEDWFSGPEPAVQRIAEIRVPEDQQNLDWNWNSRYWRSFGAPWGGLLTTPADLARFATMMLRGGELGGRRILSPAAVATATRNQLLFMKDMPERDRRCQPWGLGWRLHRPSSSAHFGDLLSPAACGHWGSTGTVLWIDPERDAFAVILTTQPQDPHGPFVARLSNRIAAALQ